jgi:chromosome segregation ATPase
VAHERVAAVQQQIDALQALPEMDSEQRLQVEQARDNAEHTLQELAGSIARVKSCRKWLEDLAKKTSAVETARQKATEAARLLEIFMQAEAVELRRAEAALAVKPAAAALQAAETRLSKHSEALESAARLRETATTKLGEKNTAAEAARRQQQSQAPPLEEALAAVRGQMRPQEAALALLRESAGRTRKTAGEKAAELRKAQEEHKRLLQNEEELRQQLEKLHRQKQEMTPEEGLTERLPLLQARLEDWKKAPLAEAELPPHEELEADLQATHQAVEEAAISHLSSYFLLHMQDKNIVREI